MSDAERKPIVLVCRHCGTNNALTVKDCLLCKMPLDPKEDAR